MIYFDNAATTFPKPECMLLEMSNCIKKYCGNPGRSGHPMSLKASEKIYECRETLADFFGSSSPENVVFTLNTTHALNIAIKTYYEEGSHVLVSNMEHNSVIRPISLLREKKHISYSIFNVLQDKKDIIKELQNKLQANTKMLICTHASNICGRIFPIKEIGEFCKRNNLIFIVDAAQSAGTSEIHADLYNIDALCVPAHKGLYGPQGLGFVIFGKKPPLRTIIEGGNGTNSLSLSMGNEMPESFEAGTLPTPSIAGLNSSVKWLLRIGINNIKSHETELAALMIDRLSEISGSIIYQAENTESGIVLYDNSKMNSDLLSLELDKRSICTRNGFHCAPLAHHSLGTKNHGALRFSFSCFIISFLS